MHILELCKLLDDLCLRDVPWKLWWLYNIKLLLLLKVLLKCLVYVCMCIERRTLERSLLLLLHQLKKKHLKE